MNVAMFHLGEDAHPSHRGFAESINADLVSCSDSTLSPHSPKSFINEFYQGVKAGNYDVVIAEGARPLYAGLVNKLIHNTTVIYLGAEHRLHEILNSEVKVHSPYTYIKHSLSDRGFPIIKSILEQAIDGALVVSELMKEVVKQFVKDQTPIRITHPHVQQPLFDQLGKLDPTPDSKIVTTVGRPASYKGVDILVDAWEQVHRSHPKAELHIIGEGHPKEYEMTPGVRVRGYVSNLTEVYSKSGLYVQPSRVDAFPVTVLEALRGSVPAIVTDTTGTKSAVKKLSERFIARSTPNKLSNRIDWWLDQDTTVRNKYSIKAKGIGSSFDPESRKKIFRREFDNIVTEVGSTG